MSLFENRFDCCIPLLGGGGLRRPSDSLSPSFFNIVVCCLGHLGKRMLSCSRSFAKEAPPSAITAQADNGKVAVALSDYGFSGCVKWSNGAVIGASVAVPIGNLADVAITPSPLYSPLRLTGPLNDTWGQSAGINFVELTLAAASTWASWGLDSAGVEVAASPGRAFAPFDQPISDFREIAPARALASATADVGANPKVVIVMIALHLGRHAQERHTAWRNVNAAARTNAQSFSGHLPGSDGDQASDRGYVQLVLLGAV